MSLSADRLEVVLRHVAGHLLAENVRLHVRCAEVQTRPDAGLDDLVERLREAVNRSTRRRRASNTSFGQLASEDAVVSVAAMSTTVQESPPVLTPRQKQVVELIAAGCSNEEVGERLGISPRTAKAHCDVLRQKLGVARRRQIPLAYRELTGDDPLSKSLAPGHPGSGD